MEIVVHSKKSLFQQKLQKKLYHFNRNSQFWSVMQKMIQLDIPSRSWTKKSDSQCCWESYSDSTQKPPSLHDSDFGSDSATLFLTTKNA